MKYKICYLITVCASLALSTFCASAQTDNLGTASCPALALSFDDDSLPSLPIKGISYLYPKSTMRFF